MFRAVYLWVVFVNMYPRMSIITELSRYRRDETRGLGSYTSTNPAKIKTKIKTMKSPAKVTHLSLFMKYSAAAFFLSAFSLAFISSMRIGSGASF